MSEGAKMAAAMLMAQNDLRSVAKDATNAHHKYAYVSAEAMIGAARAALHRAGLVLMRTGWQVVDGNDQRPSLVLCDYVLMHTSGEIMKFESLPWYVIEQNGRPIDKALAGALTTSMSYFLRDLLLIPKLDGEEVDQRDDTKHIAGVLGVKGAVDLRKRLKDACLDLSELIDVMRSKGIEVSTVDAAAWSKDLMPRINAWIAKRKKEMEVEVVA